MPKSQPIGPQIEAARLKRGLTQAELADASGISQPYISQIESGNRGTSVALLQLLADALGAKFTLTAERATFRLVR